MKKLLILSGAILLAGAGCAQVPETAMTDTAPAAEVQAVSGIDFIDEIRDRDTTYYYEVWNADKTKAAIVWGDADVTGKPFGISYIEKNDAGEFVLADENHVLVGALEHLYVDDVRWDGDTLRWNNYVIDEGGMDWEAAELDT